MPDLCPICRAELVVTGRGWTEGAVYFVTRQCAKRCQAPTDLMDRKAGIEWSELVREFKRGKIRRVHLWSEAAPCWLCAEFIEPGQPYYERPLSEHMRAHVECVELHKHYKPPPPTRPAIRQNRQSWKVRYCYLCEQRIGLGVKFFDGGSENLLSHIRCIEAAEAARAQRQREQKEMEAPDERAAGM